jgi:hypothetical protein
MLFNKRFYFVIIFVFQSIPIDGKEIIADAVYTKFLNI